MIKARFAVAVVAVAGLANSSTMVADWYNADDIPVTEPVTVGLAGEKPADIVRFLMANGAKASWLSPDGSQLAYEWSITGEPQLWIVDADGGASQQITFGSGISFFRWAPNGRHLVVGRDADGNERNGYFLISSDGTTESELLPLSDAFRDFGMFSLDGKEFLYPEISPVNSFRVIFNRYFGAKFELLPDRSFFSTAKFLYKFHDVTDRVRTPSK